MRGRMWAWGVAMVVLVSACGGKDSIERQLAAADGSSSTGDYRAVLDSLDGKCREGRQRIGDLGVRGAAALRRERGTTITALGYLQLMDRAIPAGARDQSCEEAAIAVAFLVG